MYEKVSNPSQCVHAFVGGCMYVSMMFLCCADNQASHTTMDGMKTDEDREQMWGQQRGGQYVVLRLVRKPCNVCEWFDNVGENLCAEHVEVFRQSLVRVFNHVVQVANLLQTS